MLISIKNENVSAAVETLGAELVSFKSTDDFEHIWQGDPKYWGGHAPVLFPIVERHKTFTPRSIATSFYNARKK